MPAYQTSDFLKATVFSLLRHRLLGLDRSDPKRVVFQFEDAPELRDDLRKLEADELLVSPNDFWAAQRRCKALLYEEGGL